MILGGLGSAPAVRAVDGPPAAATGAAERTDGAASVPSRPEDVVREVVERNQGTEALDLRAAAAAEVPSQVGSLPDPMFLVGLSNLPLSTDSTPLTGVQFELRQTFPWPGKLALRERAAEHGARAQRHLVAERRNLLRARAWSLLWELAFLEEHRRLANEMVDTLKQFVKVAEATYVSGTGRQQDLIKPQVERYRIEDLLITIERQSKIIKSRINAMRHRPPDAPVDPPEISSILLALAGQSAGDDGKGKEGQTLGNAPFQLGKFMAFADDHNPLLKAANSRIEAARSMLDLAGKDYFPDITVGLQYRLRWVETMDAVGGADFVGLTVGVNLPVWFATKQGPAESQRASELSAALADARRLQDEIADGIERTLQAIRRDLSQAAIYRDKIIPETRQALESSLADYRAGRLEFISVLDNLLKLFAAKVDLARRTSRVQASLAELQHLLGGRPEWLGRDWRLSTNEKERENDR